MIREYVATLAPGTLVIQGGAQGADKLAGFAALRLGLPVAQMDAAWQFYGKRAGPIRNQWMLDYLAPTEAHGFHEDIEASRGTKDMRDRCKRAGLLFTLHDDSSGSRPRDMESGR